VVASGSSLSDKEQNGLLFEADDRYLVSYLFKLHQDYAEYLPHPDPLKKHHQYNNIFFKEL
jgi:hypothetical protein